MPEEMMPIEALSSGALGVWTAVVIAWLRERRFLSGKNSQTTKLLTLSASYLSMVISVLGIQWTVNGDALTGWVFQVSVPDANHLLEGMVLVGTNMTGQKGFAMLYKISNAMSVLAKTTAAAADPNSAKRLELEKRQAEIDAQLADLEPKS